MANENLASGFRKAIETGWDDLWQFGLGATSQIVVHDKYHAAYCLLMNIATFGKFDSHAIEIIKTNLASRRYQPTAAKNQ